MQDVCSIFTNMNSLETLIIGFPMLSLLFGMIVQVMIKRVWTGPLLILLFQLWFMRYCVQDNEYVVWVFINTASSMVGSFIVFSIQWLFRKKRRI